LFFLFFLPSVVHSLSSVLSFLVFNYYSCSHLCCQFQQFCSTLLGKDLTGRIIYESAVLSQRKPNGGRARPSFVKIMHLFSSRVVYEMCSVLFRTCGSSLISDINPHIERFAHSVMSASTCTSTCCLANVLN